MARAGRTNTVRRRIRVRISIAAVVIGSLCSIPVVNLAGSGETKGKRPKLDRVLQEVASHDGGTKHRVIVRARHDRVAAVADRIDKHGDHIESRHTRLDAFTATVHGGDLRALEADSDVESISVDAVITSHAETQAGPQGALDDQNLLLSALGLSDTTYTGDKIGVAVIDSGLEESSDLSGARGDRLQISITDTGQGIADTDLPHIFEPFFSTKPEGSGIGLALVYRVVEEHGGSIEVRSRVGEGTTFALTLPAPEGAARR